MPILKHYKQTGFVQIPNVLAQSTQLSYEALGVLVNLLSRPEDWVVHKISFRNSRCGEVMVNRIFKELQVTGYLKLVDERINGQIANRLWIVSDEPMLPSENDQKTLGNLNGGKPQFEETSIVGNQVLQIKNNTNKEESLKNTYNDGLDSCESNEPLPAIFSNSLKSKSKEKSTKADSVPYKEIMDLYNDITADTSPPMPACKFIKPGSQRAKHVKARWEYELPTLAHWEKLFKRVVNSSFLSGRAKPMGDRKPFLCNFDWIINESNCEKILEDNYSDARLG